MGDISENSGERETAIDSVFFFAPRCSGPGGLLVCPQRLPVL